MYSEDGIIQSLLVFGLLLSSLSYSEHSHNMCYVIGRHRAVLSIVAEQAIKYLLPPSSAVIPA